MAKKKIYVGAEYSKAFESICELIKSGCLSELGYKVIDNVIDDGVNEYVLIEKENQRSNVKKHGFTDKGATWFGAFRGEETEKDDAIWTTFIENVKEEYHKRFSVVEYKQQPPTKAEKEQANGIINKFVNDFVDTFYPSFSNKVEVHLSPKGGEEDIYGVAFRMELSGGTGASLPVLGKVYFIKNGKTLSPIEKETSAIYDRSVNQIIPEDTGDNEIIVADEIIDSTLNSIEKIVTDTNSNFADYLCFSDISDEKAVKKLLSQLSHDSVKLECTRLDILYIMHIKISAFLAEATYFGETIFRVKMGANNSFTVKCAKCNSEQALVYNNQIAYKVDGVDKLAVLDFEKEQFGLDDQVIDEIIINSEIKNHYFKISCPKVKGWQTCEKIRCYSQVFDGDSGETVDYKCIDCPYPEVVYTTGKGEKKYTPMLVFAKDKMELVDPLDVNEERVERCAVCGRYFSIGALKNKKCSVCRASETATFNHSDRLRYKKYKTLLSFGRRATAGFGKKACVEDNEIMIFIIGKHRYLFNKLNVKEKGFIAPPVKID